MKILFIILFLCFAQFSEARGPSINSKSAASIRTKTTEFDGILDGEDTNVQKALETIDDLNFQTLPCEITDNWCFKYEANVLKLYVNGTAQWQSPIVAVFDNLLLENGDFFLLETGDKLRLE